MSESLKSIINISFYQNKLQKLYVKSWHMMPFTLSTHYVDILYINRENSAKTERLLIDTLTDNKII